MLYIYQETIKVDYSRNALVKLYTNKLKHPKFCSFRNR